MSLFSGHLRSGRKDFPCEEGTERLKIPHASAIRIFVAKIFPVRRELKGRHLDCAVFLVGVAKIFPVRRELKVMPVRFQPDEGIGICVCLTNVGSSLV